MSPQEFDYSTIRREQQTRLRSAIVDAAAELLATGGLGGLSVRAIAANVGASTKVIYSHCGGKPGIISALYSRGFESLAKTMKDAASTGGTPRVRLLAVARAYRDFAVASPHLYELMYGPRVRELLPSPDDRDDARRLQTIVTELFVEAQAEGQFRKSDPVDLSRIFWAALHGCVSLELTNWFTLSEGEQRLDQLITIVLDGEVIDPDRDSGDTSTR